MKMNQMGTIEPAVPARSFHTYGQTTPEVDCSRCNTFRLCKGSSLEKWNGRGEWLTGNEDIGYSELRVQPREVFLGYNDFRV